MPLIRKPAATSPVSGPEAAEVLVALHSPDVDARWAAARAAGALAGATSALAAALRVETEPQVREALFTSLARMGTPEGAAELIGCLRSDQSALRTGALDVLRTMGAEVGELLPRLLGDADADIRVLSCELARSLPADEATGLLAALLGHEPEANVCAAAIDVLAEVGTAAACPVLEQCAARFAQHPFLAFAARTAINRITSQPAHTRV